MPSTMNYWRLSILLIVAAALATCKNQVYLTVVEPPFVKLSSEYLSIGVVNRSISSGTGKIIDVLDAGLSAEGPKLDLEGSQASIQGCFDELGAMNRFERIILLDSMRTEKPLPEIMPEALSWDEIEKICIANDVQVLFSLETYDTDTKINYSTRTVMVKSPIGGEIPMLEHHVDMNTLIRQGWRIYLPDQKMILDQFFTGDNMNSHNKGINPVKALEGLITRKDAVVNLSNRTGHRYASRIASVPFRVTRDYFTRGSSGIRKGHRQAMVNDWTGAGESWLTETKSTKRKTAGRACHNMAIIEEINGNLDAAITWSQKAYTDYRIKSSRFYSRILQGRMNRIVSDESFE